jgi:trk system potassium uptake protein TrkA
LGDRNRSRRRRRPAGPRTTENHDRQILVLGLGRFGSSVAHECMRLEFEVLGVDSDARRVQAHADPLTHVLQADTTDVEALRQIGAGEFAHAVVGIGTDIEASILTTANLDDLGVPNIWAKAVTQPHGRILERVGAHHVVYPEHDMGQRLAHLVGGHILEWIQLDTNFAMVETHAPAELLGTSLRDAGIRARYGVTVVCVKPVGEGFTYATPDTVLAEGDVVVVAGPPASAERFGALP